jgi:hypothetical protein
MRFLERALSRWVNTVQKNKMLLQVEDGRPKERENIASFP